jgi:hypothetical protein
MTSNASLKYEYENLSSLNNVTSLPSPLKYCRIEATIPWSVFSGYLLPSAFGTAQINNANVRFNYSSDIASKLFCILFRPARRSFPSPTSQTFLFLCCRQFSNQFAAHLSLYFVGLGTVSPSNLGLNFNVWNWHCEAILYTTGFFFSTLIYNTMSSKSSHRLRLDWVLTEPIHISSSECSDKIAQQTAGKNLSNAV